ncbi:MAG TPA: PAS domain S-box protein [Desulfuromonadales bacterium]|nr:PAS domain S-box protein [Desulfuromonadales bacterium]
MAPPLQDIIDIPSVQGLMASLYRITGIPATILDESGKVLLKSGSPTLCEFFHKAAPFTRNCFLEKSFRRGVGRRTTTEGWTEFCCDSGLIDVGAQIMIDKRPVATLLVGPMLYETPKPADFMARAEEFGERKEAWLQHLAEVPVVDPASIPEVLQFYTSLIKILTDYARRSLLHNEARDEAEHSRSRLQDLFALNPDGVVLVDLHGRLLQVNPGLSQILGYAEKEMLNANITDYVSPEYAGRVSTSIRKVLNGEATLFKVSLRHQDGRKVPVEIRARDIMFDGCHAILGQVRDMSERLQSEQALLESEERFRGVFQEAGIGMALTDQDGRFVQVNSEFCRFLGYSERELLQKNIDDITHSEDRLPGKQLRADALAGKRSVVSAQKRYLHKDGSIVWGSLTTVYRVGGPHSSPLSVVMVQDITAQKLAQEAAQASEATLKSILTAVPVSVGLVRNRVFCWVNRWMVEELGYAEEELIGQNARLLYESDEEYERIGREKYDRVKAGHMGEVKTRFLCRDGRGIDVLVRSVPIDPETLDAGVIFAALNISELQKADLELRKALGEAETARQQMFGILRSVVAGLIVIDLEGRISMMNPSVESLLGRKAADMIGKPVDQLIESREFLGKVDLALAGSEQPDAVELALGKNCLQIKVTSVKDMQGIVRGAVAILRDVTREHAINQMKDEFISAAAHELRTPMTSILGYTELMLDQLEDFETDQLKDFLQVVFERSLSLSQIISDMLDLSRVQSGRLISLEKSPGQLLDLARQIVSSYEYNNTGCNLVIEADDDLPMMLFDARKMTQVFDNLLSNAVKFSPQGGKITLSLHRELPGVTVAVKDQGIGMSPQQQERIFDKFFRADYSNTAASGLGLGMTLVKSIVEGHGGKIWVESEVGSGTSVFFSLPIIQ